MSFGKQELLLLAFALLAVCSWSVPAQAQEEESKTAPRTGAISGRVVNENGQPISHAAINVNPQRALSQPRTAITDEGGNFQVNGLDAMIYLVNVSAPSYITAPREPDTPPTYYRIGDSTTTVMLKGGVITGTVTSASGEPLVQAGVRAVLLRDANGKPPSGARFLIERRTDDRGIYRIYGLPAGTYLVSAGGRGNYGFPMNPYETDAPTYAPSSTRDMAAEIAVTPGQETSGVDIRHRGEHGYAISGIVNGPSGPNAAININLAQVVNGFPQAAGFAYQPPNSKGFAFYGIADGTYDLVAQTFVAGEMAASEARRITVKGANVAGIELVVKPLASIKGRVSLEASKAVECKNKRQPSFSETLIVARRSDKNMPSDQVAFPNFYAPTPPDATGNFVLPNLVHGHRDLSVQFFAKYWYVRSITQDAPTSQPSRDAATSRQKDLARNGLNLKFGERVSGVTFTLAEGAASLRGMVKLAPGESVPERLYVHLVPAEKESAEDVLRFFTTPVKADGTFVVNNLPPGRYLALARIAALNHPTSDWKLRRLEEAETRAEIRRVAETSKTVVEFKSCQNMIDYELPFKKN